MVQGQVQVGWESVAQAFACNFEDHGEVGAGLSIVHKGQVVIDIWGGRYSNRALEQHDQPWTQATLVNIFSAGKGLVALAVLQLVEQGLLHLDAPVSHYWPEFAQNGKQDISVRQILSHQSGLSAFHEKLADSEIYDWPNVIQRVENETSWWPQGEGQGYSPFIYGWILGELVCRVTGAKSFNDYFQVSIAQKVGAQIYFGVPEAQLANIADTGPLKRNLDKITSPTDATSAALGNIMKADPRGVTNRAFTNPLSLMTSTNSLVWRRAQIPAANAHANAAGIAKIYGALAAANSGSLLAESYRSLCWAEQTFSQDQVLGLPLRFSHGFMLSRAERADCSYGRGERAFGHPGAGGSLGFADPDFEIGFGYVTSRMGQSLLIDDRAVVLIDAIYKLLK